MKLSNVFMIGILGWGSRANICFGLLLTALTVAGQILPATAHPYQDFPADVYAAEQEKWRAMIKRDPKNPELYLKLAAAYSSESAEGYWCETRAIATYREAIAAIPGNAKLHLNLGAALMSEPVNCDEVTPEAIQEGLFHLRKAVAIASETASSEDLYKAAEALNIRNRE
jgi:hypothetical protein